MTHISSGFPQDFFNVTLNFLPRHPLSRVQRGPDPLQIAGHVAGFDRNKQFIG
jgi:hypothetical protein